MSFKISSYVSFYHFTKLSAESDIKEDRLIKQSLEPF